MFLASGFLISDPVMCERGLNLLILNADRGYSMTI
jgi:hypothetical protein